MKQYHTITRRGLLTDQELNTKSSEGWNLEFFHSEIMNGHTHTFIYIFSKNV